MSAGGPSADGPSLSLLAAVPGGMMNAITKHSVVIDGHKTSVSLEAEFWRALSEIAAAESRSLNALIGEIDRQRAGNLSSALRLYVLAHYRRRAAEVEAAPEQQAIKADRPPPGSPA
jgi:predicted DNA-binding ribbon-helix-helix protein